jgi:zinc/manganese transport system permease protein
MGFLDLMKWPSLAALVMSPVHCLFGLHIVRRGVIFIDLAVAQMAGLGMAIAVANGYDVQASLTYWVSLAFALGAALVIALTRFRLNRVPHEAIIGIMFVVASALGIVVLSGSAHGVEELRDIMSGNILFVSQQQVEHTAIIYGLILVSVVLMWKRITAISLDRADAPTGWQRVFFDFAFYGLLAFVVASSVKIAGVLVVFTWLVMPPVCAFLWLSKMKHGVMMSLPLALLGSLGGLWMSYARDWPDGPAIVTVFGALVAFLYVVKLLVPERPAEEVQTA